MGEEDGDTDGSGRDDSGPDGPNRDAHTRGGDDAKESLDDAEGSDDDAEGHTRGGTPGVENPFAGVDDAEGSDTRPADDPGVDPADDPGVDPADDLTDDTDADTDGPLGDLAREVNERRNRRRDVGEEDPFEEVDVGEIDGEELWAALAAEEPTGYEPPAQAADPVEASDPADTRPEHVVDKREFCQRCPFLSDPPAVSCEHEGTDIVEAVTPESFRVRGCPMVSEDGSPDFSAGEDAVSPDVDVTDGDATRVIDSEAKGGSEVVGGGEAESDDRVDADPGDVIDVHSAGDSDTSGDPGTTGGPDVDGGSDASDAPDASGDRDA